EAAMSHSNYQMLIHMGRKAGLNTADLYRALSARPPDRQSSPGQTDCNGYTGGLSRAGRMEYHPTQGRGEQIKRTPESQRTHRKPNAISRKDAKSPRRAPREIQLLFPFALVLGAFASLREMSFVFLCVLCGSFYLSPGVAKWC